MDNHTNNSPGGEHARPAVRIDKLVYGGAGLGRHEGRAVLVPLTLPGDLVEVAVSKEKSGYWEGNAVHWLERSAQHVEPGCSVFGTCGGCHYQHLGYPQQVEAKLGILREVLRRIGKLDAPEEIPALTGEPWHYRNRSQFHIDRAQIGFHRMLSNRLVGIQTCPISSPRINEALAQLKKLLHDPHWPRFLRSLELFTNEEKVMVNVRETDGNRRLAKGFFEWLAKTVEGASDGELYYEAAGFRFRVSHGSFFQVNRHLAGPLVSEALGDAEGRSALDLYAGVGLFSLPLAQRFQQVQAVETDTAAVRDLTVNAEAHGCGIAVQRLQAEQYLEGVTERPDFILADPPRAGLGKHAVRHLLRLRSPRLVLVSCDPSTLARDLAVLLGGGYRLRRLSMVDLFPQTYHIETVAHLIL